MDPSNTDCRAASMRFSNQAIGSGMRRRPFMLNCDPGQEMDSEESSWGYGKRGVQKILGYGNGQHL